MDNLKLRSRLQDKMEELKQRQGLDSDGPRDNWMEQRRAAIVRAYDEPVLPKLGKLLFVSMLVITGALVLAEVCNFFRYASHFGVERLLYNLSRTGISIWLIYTAVLLPVCGLGCCLNQKAFRKRQRESGTEDVTREDCARSARAIRRLNGAYRHYAAIAAAGLAVWTVFYFAVSWGTVR